METLRQEDGISGFLKRSESEYDAFGAGHAATSISAALGMAVGRDVQRRGLQGRRHPRRRRADVRTGVRRAQQRRAFGSRHHRRAERQRDVDRAERRRDVEVSQRRFSATRSTTACARRSASSSTTRPGRCRRWARSSGSGRRASRRSSRPACCSRSSASATSARSTATTSARMIDTFAAVRAMKGPRLVHVITQKGKGFPAGERSGEKWHALPPGHDPATGAQRKAVDGEPELHEGVRRRTRRAGESRDRTSSRSPPRCRAARAPTRSRRRTPTRFFDVGIAEGHAVTFAAGLATRGVRPVVAIYSTFLQRAYDNIIHDVAIQSLPVIFCMDRAGLVGEDGETHMGLYDIAYMLAVPGMTVTAPKDATEMLALLRTARAHTARSVLASLSARRGAGQSAAPIGGDRAGAVRDVGGAAPRARRRDLRRRHDGAAVARRGRALAAEGLNVTVVNCRFLKPYDEVTLAAILADHKHILVVEEGTVVNGFGAFMSSVIARYDPSVRVSRARRAGSRHSRGAARAPARGVRPRRRRASPSAFARCTRARRSPGDPPRRRRAPRIRRASRPCCGRSSELAPALGLELYVRARAARGRAAASALDDPQRARRAAHARRRRHAAARRARDRAASRADSRHQPRAPRLSHVLQRRPALERA